LKKGFFERFPHLIRAFRPDGELGGRGRGWIRLDWVELAWTAELVALDVKIDFSGAEKSGVKNRLVFHNLILSV
jgi:hypothetical protein